MKKYSILIIILISISSLKLISQDQYINPGIKLGYQFGNNGGFVYGIEVSFVDTKKSLIGGITGGVFDLDFCDSKVIMHLGFQESSLPFGYDIGPSLLFSDNKISFGGTLNIFGGFILIPFFGYNFFPRDRVSFSQLGTYLKYPVNIRNLY